ncbi:hypothetical protein MMC30_006756 [Trapelia coarctata]|nr:hypothetical protein [Trapelia coarctata]
MKLANITPLALLLAPLASALPQLEVITRYETLSAYCKAAGPDAYVGVLYEGGLITSYNYNECYPYSIEDKVAVQAVFCKSVKCFSNPNTNCTGGSVPRIGVVIPAGTTLVNVANFVKLTGEGATCEKNDAAAIVPNLLTGLGG